MTSSTASKQQRFSSPHVAEPPPGLWSNCIRVDNMIWLSGFTSRASDPTEIQGSDAYEQSQAIFTKIKNCLEAAGSQMADVVNMNIYVTDMADNKAVWKARQEFFTADFPCSTLVQVASLADPRIKLEITCQAIVGSGKA